MLASCFLPLASCFPKISQNLRQFRSEFVCQRLTNGQFDGAGIVELLFHDTRIHLLHDTHHLVHHRIREMILHNLLHLSGDDLRMINGISGRCLISHNQSAGTQVHTPVITHNDNQDIRKLIRVDLSQDGFSCRATEFAIVVSPELQPVGPKHVGIAHMTGIKVFLPVLSDDLLDLRNIGYRMCKSEELTTLFGVVALADGFDGFEFVH